MVLVKSQHFNFTQRYQFCLIIHSWQQNRKKSESKSNLKQTIRVNHLFLVYFGLMEGKFCLIYRRYLSQWKIRHCFFTQSLGIRGLWACSGLHFCFHWSLRYALTCVLKTTDRLVTLSVCLLALCSGNETRLKVCVVQRAAPVLCVRVCASLSGNV